ncbi:MAG: hypothetical protein AB1558_04480 [Thermodesulfobacteriota bacterium]
MGLTSRSLSMIPPLLLYWMGFGTPAAADLFTYRDSGGRWVITDSPPGGAQIIHIIRETGATSSRPSLPTGAATDRPQSHPPKTEAAEPSPGPSAVGVQAGEGSGLPIHKKGDTAAGDRPAGPDANGVNRTPGDKGRAGGTIAGEPRDPRAVLPVQHKGTDEAVPSMSRGVTSDTPAQGGQTQVQPRRVEDPPVIMKADSAAFQYGHEVIHVPADVEGRRRK